jgi:signal transduction histidine kinase
MVHDAPRIRAWPVRSAGSDVCLMFMVYAVLALAAIAVARQPGTIAVAWFANGAAIALIASAPPRRGPLLLLAAVCGNLAANLAYGDALTFALAFLVPNAIEVMLGVVLLRRVGRTEGFTADQGSYLRVLAAGALLPPLLGATAGAATLHLVGFGSFQQVWLDWYIGAALGSVAVLPLVLALRAGSAAAVRERLTSPLTLLALVGAALVAPLALHFTPYPFVAVGVSLTFVAFVRPRLVTFACAPLVVAALAVSLATGWYVPASASTALGHALVYLSAGLVVVPAQLVAVVLARQRTLSDLLVAVGSRADEIVVFVDMAGVYRWANKAREIYWGVPNEQVIGRTWQQNTSEAAWLQITKPLFEQARGGAVARQQVEFDYPVRGRRSLDMIMQPAFDEEGHQIGVLYSGTDTTEFEATRRQLQKLADGLQASNQSLEQFVRIASHDLREPMNTVMQFCDLLARDHAAQLDAAGSLYLKQVQGGAARMVRMLNDVLQFVRVDGSDLAAMDTVDLDQVVAEVLDSLKSSLDTAQARVSVAPLGKVTGHRVLIALVVQNLVSNALKFSPADRSPEIKVTAARTPGQLRLSVTDNGIGIDAARISELGAPFKRLHARRKFEGTGLGLAICWRVAQQHAGAMEVQSVAGQGSRFTLVLPVTDSAGAGAGAGTGSEQACASERH